MSVALPVDDGWTEVVVAVADVEVRARDIAAATGWVVRHRGPVDARIVAAWQLPKGATAREVVLAEPQSTRGFVRLVAFSNAGPQTRIRSSAQPWERGGWGGINVRVANIDVAFQKLQRAGWQGFSDPVTFTVPPYTVREAMLVGPDGLVLGLLERVSPPLSGWSWPSTASRPVTVFAPVPDDGRAENLLGRTLGLKRRLGYDGPAAPPGANLFALPHDVTPGLKRRVGWFQAVGNEEGTIATVAFSGLVGRDHSGEARPPNFGLFLARLPIADAKRRCSEIEQNRPEAIVSRYRATIAMIGPVEGCIITMPGGGWLDLFSLQNRAAAASKDHKQ